MGFILQVTNGGAVVGRFEEAPRCPRSGMEAMRRVEAEYILCGLTGPGVNEDRGFAVRPHRVDEIARQELGIQTLHA